MRKLVYIVCFIGLCISIYQAVQLNHGDYQTSSKRIVPTARFLSELKKENQTEKKVAYLTFDDGPSELTPKVLRILEQEGVRATFFLIGSEMTPEREEIVKELAVSGHAIGVHTYYHKQNKIYCSCNDFFQDFEMAATRIAEVTGERPKLHRFPWGSNNGYLRQIYQNVHAKLSEQGIRSFDWTCSGEDAVGNPSGYCIMKNIRKELERSNEPVILLHDALGRENTVRILPDIIKYIREKGYTFATLEEREEYLFPDSWRKK